MKTAAIILLTIVWLASWTSIALGLSDGLTSANTAPEQVVAALDR
ncbi:hypothetical protein OKA05_04575 [Luteolibacter arcticus]|uniref:Uncharacterized protein n=1 Tax=Luteolibacter arcticus TaxID=1581411 RepID=A0ABT3GE16_9BACT|nr:hypothetical protein [Luteolibacter arcticus]MCW1921814.1 hypothetical protein [Luteolibacter arcticus]